MKNIEENVYKIHIKILYFLILLLFFIVLVQPFIIIYLLQNSNIRTASPATEVGNTKSRTSNDKDAIINENAKFAHQVRKREISSETEKNDDTINIKGNWNVKKADLLEYCFTAVDFCQKNKDKSKEEEQKDNFVGENQQEIENEQKDNFGGEMQQENRNCILQNFTDDDAFQYRIINFRLGVKYDSEFCNIEEGPKDNFKITSKTVFTPCMKEFQVNEKGEIKILKEFE
ncbi:uncharacterized protein LOC111637488 isoform X2 [Centruroides sculpturatus]|uniref:uncharacterized protein LOC111637488 isoform X2 n=1 Tax=Centruroides sculpturatus TaxID=218467 RepID=UPI000C6EB512|nr:uncharacterized protein LOC111637488 isoform X2 [Centruroides sculpturatus]